MSDPSVTMRHVTIPHPDIPNGFNDYTDVLIVAEGRHFYSRYQGHLALSLEGYCREQFLRRQQPGFYRIEG